ncbi:hypothetical protein [Streptomyces sp. NPDC001401]|uniref:hypothetical protein n=1 Tax=Streptomyces sp. NPDC001401 TaxID=3364570 RepID=UPI0036B75756
MTAAPSVFGRPVPLTHDVTEWNEAAHAAGLKAYECKASYICGAMREFMQASGLNLENGYHLGALFLALDAMELLGRVVTGARRTTNRSRKSPGELGANEALRRGVKYLNAQADPQATPLPHSPQDYTYLRNFAAHGATHLEPGVNFDPDSTRLLLQHLAHALNTMWGDPAVPTKLAAVEIHPVYSADNGRCQPVYVHEVQEHIKEHRPGDELLHNDWQNDGQDDHDDIVTLDNSSPAVTGTGSRLNDTQR